MGCKKEDENESDTAIGHIVDLGELIAHLRGVVGTFESSHTNRRIYNNNSQQNKQSSNSNSVTTTLTSPNNLRSIDFENDLPIIEEASRAIMHLKSLAMGHAISKGRNYFISEDIPIVIKLVLSTASIARVRIFDLLLEHKGELTTSEIVKELRISHHTAHRTMTELNALELVDKTPISTYDNSEYKIKLKEKFSWFTSDEFERLREGFRPADYNKLKYRINVTESSTEPNTEENPFECDKIDPCDSHMLASFSPSETDIYEGNNSTNEASNAVNGCSSSHTNESESTRSNDDNNNINEDNSSKNNSLREQNNSTSVTELDKSLTSIDNQKATNQQKNNNEASLMDAKNFKHVTQSQSHGLYTSTELSSTTIRQTQLSPEQKTVLEVILDEIKSANGSEVAVNAVISSSYSKSEEIRAYLGDKLTSRENRKIRDLFLMIIRHPNIDAVKHKPQLIVRWTSSLQTEQDSHDQPVTKHENAKVSIDGGTENR